MEAEAMPIDRFVQKAQEALRQAQHLVRQYNHPNFMKTNRCSICIKSVHSTARYERIRKTVLRAGQKAAAVG